MGCPGQGRRPQGPRLCPSGWAAWRGSTVSGPDRLPWGGHGGHSAPGPLWPLRPYPSPALFQGSICKPSQRGCRAGEQRRQVIPAVAQLPCSPAPLGLARCRCRDPSHFCFVTAGVTSFWGVRVGLVPRLWVSGCDCDIHPPPIAPPSCSHSHSGAPFGPPAMFLPGSLPLPAPESPAATGTRLRPAPPHLARPLPASHLTMRKSRLRRGHRQGAAVPTLEHPQIDPNLVALGSPALHQEWALAACRRLTPGVGAAPGPGQQGHSGAVPGPGSQRCPS